MKKLKRGDDITYYEYTIEININEYDTNGIVEDINEYDDTYNPIMDEFNVIKEFDDLDDFSSCVELTYKYINKKDLTTEIKDKMFERIIEIIKKSKEEKIKKIELYDKILKDKKFNRVIRKQKLEKII